MLRLIYLLGVVGLGVLVGGGVLATMATAQSSGPDPASVIAAYETARNERDLDTALSYFADDAAINQRATAYVGKEDIRKFLETASTRARFVVVADRHTSGNRVSWTERGGGGLPRGLQAGGQGPASLGTGFQINVEAVVQDGKIRSISYFAAGPPPRPDPSLEGRAELPATVGLASVLLLLVGLLLATSTTLRRSAAANSTLRGRLLEALQGWAAARQ